MILLKYQSSFNRGALPCIRLLIPNTTDEWDISTKLHDIKNTAISAKKLLRTMDND